MKDICTDVGAVLLVIDDGEMLAMASAVLMDKRRVLRAWNTEGALWILQNLAIASVVLREGVAEFGPVYEECLQRGLPVYQMSGHVEADFVRIALPQLLSESLSAAADEPLHLPLMDLSQPWESPESPA